MGNFKPDKLQPLTLNYIDSGRKEDFVVISKCDKNVFFETKFEKVIWSHYDIVMVTS